MAGMNSRAASRASRTDGTSSRDALVVMVAVAVLAVTAVIVLVGLFFTSYRPPRATALTIEGEPVNAAQVQRRLLYLMFNETAVLGSDQTQFVSKTLDRMERDEVLLRRSGSLLPSTPDAEAVSKHLREMLAPPAAPTPQITTNQPGLTVASPDATPVPMSDEAYAKALQDRLKNAEMGQDELERIARVDLIDTQLRAKFRDELSKNGPQVQLVVARLTDKAKADQVRSIGLRPGVDFAQVANVNSVGGGGPTGDLGWVIPEELKQSVRDAVGALKPGELSPVTTNGIYFEVYKVVASETSREYEAEQLKTLTDQKFDAWVAAEREHVKIERVLSTDTDKWILDGALSRFRSKNAQPGG